MQKYVSCGATWWILWCFLGKIMWRFCSVLTHHGSAVYVCDHLCIWLVKVTNSASVRAKHVIVYQYLICSGVKVSK